MNFDVDYILGLMRDISESNYKTELGEDEGDTTSDTSTSTPTSTGKKWSSGRTFGKTYMNDPNYKWESGRTMGKTYQGPGYVWDSGVSRGHANPVESVGSKQVIKEQNTYYYDAQGNLQGGGPIQVPKGVRMASDLYPGMKQDLYPKKLPTNFQPQAPLFASQYWKDKPAPKAPEKLPSNYYEYRSGPPYLPQGVPLSRYNGTAMSSTEANKLYQRDIAAWAYVNIGPKPTPPLVVTQGPQQLRDRINKYVDITDYNLDVAKFNRENNQSWISWMNQIRPYMVALHDYRMKAEPAYKQNYLLRQELTNRSAQANTEIGNIRDLGGFPSREAQRDATATTGYLQNTYTMLVGNVLNKYNIPELQGLVDTTAKRQAVEDDEDLHLYLTFLSLAVSLLAPPLMGLTTSQAFAAASAIDALEGYMYYKDGNYTDAGESWMISTLAAIPELSVLSKVPGSKLNRIVRAGSTALRAGTDLVLSAELKASLRTAVDGLSDLAKSAPIVRQALINAAPTATLKTALKAVTSEPAVMIGGIYLSMMGYEKAAELFKSTTPASTLQSLGLDWNSAKQYFYSSGSEEDNLLLKDAVLHGWKPGEQVPEQFQTQLYKDIVVKRQEEFNKLTQERERQEKQKQENLKQQQEKLKNNQLKKEEVTQIVHQKYVDKEGNIIPPSEIGKKVNLQGFKDFLKNKNQ